MEAQSITENNPVKRYGLSSSRPILTLLRQIVLLVVVGWSINTQAAVDLTGTYDVATLTPLERPVIFGNNRVLSREEAEKNSTG